jgi:hypothetical protein
MSTSSSVDFLALIGFLPRNSELSKAYLQQSLGFRLIDFTTIAIITFSRLITKGG